MHSSHRPPDDLRGRVFARRDVSGRVSDDALAAGAYERLTRGAWRAVPAGGSMPTYGERVAGFLAVLPPRAVLVGRTAAWAYGAWEPAATDEVEVVVFPPGSVRSREGLAVSGRRLRADEVTRRRGVFMTTPVRTAADLARAPGPPMRVVPPLDAVLHRLGLSADAVRAAVQQAPGGVGTKRAMRALSLSDGRAESPRESVLRLTVVEAGLAVPAVQHVLDPALLRTVGYRRGVRLDLAWPERKVALEYDGHEAHDFRHHGADLARHNALRALGWTVIQVDAQGMRKPKVFLDQLAALLD